MGDEIRVPLLRCEWKKGEVQAVQRVAASGRFIGGQEVRAFEDEWAAHVGAAACVGVGSGTDALTLALATLKRGWPHKQHVVLPALSFVATREAVHHAGLVPLFCGVTEDGLMDPVDLVRVLDEVNTASVLAAVPVHLYGQVCGMADISRVCGKRGVRVLEDACQAHGAHYRDGRPVGSRGMAAWSFMPAKVLGAWGDAGAVTGDSRCVTTVRMLANHGRSKHNRHEALGWNSRLDAVHAAVLRYRLQDLPDLVGMRAMLARRYIRELGGVLRCQSDSPNRTWSYFAALLPEGVDRPGFRARCRDAGVAVGVHYPYTLQNVWSDLAADPAMARAEDIAARTVTLPLWPEMTDAEQSRVCDVVRRVL